MDEPVSCRNLADLLRRSARAYGAKPALHCGESSIAWADLDRRVDAVAAALARRLAPGERVGLALGNTVEFAVAYFAVLRSGLVAVPLNTGYTGPELSSLLIDSSARAVFFDAGTADALASALEGAEGDLWLVACCDSGELSALACRVLASAVAMEELTTDGPELSGTVGGSEDLAVLLYTSGTSGHPRGAMLSHRALAANLGQLARIDPPVVRSEDVVLVVPPLFHVYGLNVGLGMTAWTGATAVLVERFDPVASLAELDRRNVTTVIGAPPMYVAWAMLPQIGEALRGVRLAVSGSAPLPAEVVAEVRE
ncbi:MAG: AMP-binding protein, partial [Mycobacteriales bacterium]